MTKEEIKALTDTTMKYLTAIEEKQAIKADRDDVEAAKYYGLKGIAIG